MHIEINRDSKTPVYKQIFKQVKSQILSGELPAGYVLPPERRLAESIGANRTTVLNAYRELKAENLITSHVGRGTVVLPISEDDNPRHKVFTEEPIWEYYFSQNSTRFESSVINSLLSYINKKDKISFASGIALSDIRTEQMLKDILRRIIDDNNFSDLFGTPTEGYISLRKAMSKFMEKRGCFCNQNDIMVLSGSQQGIDISARVLIEPGDVVVIEEPTYMPALQVFRSIGARIIGIPVDSNGMDTDMLEQVMQRYHPKLVYTMPTYHNPTGVMMSLDRRKHLIELANRFKVLVLEDDAYGELSYDGEPLPTIKSMDNSGYVIYLSTFSKIFYPGLRIGWVVTHNRLIKQFASARKSADLHTNSLSQKIIEHFISSSYYAEQLKHVCAIYKTKRDKMITALEKYAPLGMTWTIPNGGYFIWCKLPNGVLSMQLLAKCSEQSVSFLPGSIFFSSAQEHEYLRLNFTCVDDINIEKGIKIICGIVAELHKQRRRSKPDSELFPIM